ncbi:chemotaxis protein CheW [Desulfuromonas versatilis]|uniref:Chemotaxis protein CheW n=1 Tax=Desulfuromonas versatilis TaxID=2802975 RepID=A0ABM8I107_9BACT|nr:chemotaxis protein CheW [Desulfuromonas versatilis]BCR06965.1 chemotaxis protein CheW [Desulfuromonas versatilis]
MSEQKRRHRPNAEELRETLRQMREEYWQGIDQPPAAEDRQQREILVFRIGGERFAVPSVLAREVLRLPQVVRVPMVQEAIRGIINLRGEIVAVTDLARLLGQAAQELDPAGRLVVVRAAGITTALLVARVEGIRRVAADAVEPLSHGLAGLPREAVEGQVSLEGELLVLLDLKQILCRPEFVVDQQKG